MRQLVPLTVLVALVTLATAAGALEPRYHTYEEVRAELLATVAAYPAIARVDTIGASSTDGRAIWALKLSDNPCVDEDEPVVLFDGVHHAEEVLGLEVIMWMIDELTAAYGVDDTMTAWIDSNEIWFIPILNPDGHVVVTSGLDETWRKNTRDNNGNGTLDLDFDGVDPNNNYDWNWDGGDPDTTASYYRGPWAFSENETQAMRDLCEATKPVIALNYHSPLISSGDCIYYPWYWPGHSFAPDHHTIYDIAGELADRTKKGDGSSFSAVYGYATQGKARNWQYGHLGTIGLTMEILSYMCIPPPEDVDGICERVATGSYSLIERLEGPGLTGHVVDATTGAPIVADVEVLEVTSEVLDPRRTDATYGRYWRPLKAGDYTLEFSASGFETVTVGPVNVSDGPWTVVDAALWPVGTGVTDGLDEARILGVLPNPTRGQTSIRFAAPGEPAPTVEIYSLAGRLLRRLDVGADGSGAAVVWDGRDDAGRPAASGVYFARLVAGRLSDVEKIVLLR
jgi:hypothetical protein